MKKGSLLIAMILAAVFYAPAIKAETVVSVDFFYDHLDPHGSWFEMDDYGYVWRPNEVDQDWSPYSDGRWVYTDAGWTWYSNEPFGWAVYHYGRWSNIREVGWVWVPGTEWGPGWVSWRRSPRYVGWAPLPPEARFTVGIGFSSWVDRYYDIGPAHYRFVEVINLGAPRLNTVFVDRRQNITIINETTNITNITYRDNIIYNGGPAYDELVSVSREPIPRYRLERSREVALEGRRADEGDLRARIEGETLRVADFPVGDSREGRPSKIAKNISDAEVEHGWRDAGPEKEVAALREKIRSSAEIPAELPDKPVLTGRDKGKGKSARDVEGDRPSPAARPDRPDAEAPGKGRMKGERPAAPAAPEADPDLPPSPRTTAPGKGKGMRPGQGNLPSEPGEPGAPRPKGEKPDREKDPARPADRPGPRPESKGTLKDPAKPGTETEPVPAEPDRGKGKLPGERSAPGGSATPPLPPAAEERRPMNRPAPGAAAPRAEEDASGAARRSKERPSPDRAKGPSPQRPDRPEKAPERDPETEEENR